MAAFLFLLLIIIIAVSLFGKSEATGNWSHLFPDMQHDPEEFYRLVEKVLEEKQVPDFKTTLRTFKEGSILSHTRLYLEVSRGDYLFHICAAPFGTGFFFSSWARKNSSSNFLEKIPVIGPIIAEASQYEAYYKLDTDAMFKASVHQSVLTAIDRLTEAKGIRGLTELERKFDLRSMKK